MGLRLQSITPSHIARTVLVVGALAVIVWVTALAWSQLVPFQFGLVLAYITLPVVNWLDRFMPRLVAASLVVLMEFGAIVGLIALLVPVLASEVTTLLGALPDTAQVETWLLGLRSTLQDLPPPAQNLLRTGVEQIATNARANAPTYVQAVLQVALGTALGLIGTLGFILGFLGIPTWLVAVMSDHRSGIRALNRVLPASVQPDFWAIMRILDRTFSAFVRGQFLFALATACVIYAGFVLLDKLHLSTGQFRLVLAAFAGLMQLVPQVGPIIGTLPAVVVGATESPSAAIATLGMYVAAHLLLGTFVAPLVATRYVTIHSAVFVIILVLLSQFGFLWILIAAPLSIVLRDLYVYIYGRVSDPPQPAGVAPGESLPAVTPLRQRAYVARGIARG